MDGQELENNDPPADAGSAEANVPASESLNPDAAEVRTETLAAEASTTPAATESPVTPTPAAHNGAPIVPDEPEVVSAPRLPRYRVIGNISHQGAQQLEDTLNEFSKQGYELESVVRCTDGVIAILSVNRWL